MDLVGETWQNKLALGATIGLFLTLITFMINL
jgi:hypothetical protein